MMIDLPALMRLTLQDPRRGLRAVFSLGLPVNATVAALALMAVLSAVLVHLGLKVAPMPPDPLSKIFISTPFNTALIQGGILLASAFLAHGVGRVFGGRGSFGNATIMVAWLQAILLVAQAAQLVALVVLPVAAVAIALASVVLFFWLVSHFVAELHGFTSALRVLPVVIMTLIVLAFLFAFILLAIFGPEVLTNV